MQHNTWYLLLMIKNFSTTENLSGQYMLNGCKYHLREVDHAYPIKIRQPLVESEKAREETDLPYVASQANGKFSDSRTAPQPVVVSWWLLHIRTPGPPRRTRGSHGVFKFNCLEHPYTILYMQQTVVPWPGELAWIVHGPHWDTVVSCGQQPALAGKQLRGIYCTILQYFFLRILLLYSSIYMRGSPSL
jgi:hypothetical protein